MSELTAIDNQLVEVHTELRDHQRFMQKLLKEHESLDRRARWFLAAYEATRDFPYAIDATYLSATVYIHDPDSTEQTMDKEATLNRLGNLARVAIELGYKVEKNYAGDDFELKITLDAETYDRVIYYAKRDVVCTSKIVGYKTVPAKPATPPERVPVIEWDCEAVSLLDHADPN